MQACCRQLRTGSHPGSGVIESIDMTPTQETEESNGGSSKTTRSGGSTALTVCLTATIVAGCGNLASRPWGDDEAVRLTELYSDLGRQYHQPIDVRDGDPKRAKPRVDLDSSLVLEFRDPTERRVGAARTQLDDLERDVVLLNQLSAAVERLAQPGVAREDVQNDQETPEQLAERTSQVAQKLGQIELLADGALSHLEQSQIRVEAFYIAGEGEKVALPVSGYNLIASGETETTEREAAGLLPGDRERIETLRRYNDHLRKAKEAVKRASKSAELPPDAAELLAKQPKEIPEHVLPDAWISLPRADAQPGGEVSVRVRVLPKPDSGANASGQANAEAEPIAEYSYRMDVERLGLHRRDALVAIFARGDSGGIMDATDWKANFAGAVTWDWHQRNVTTGFGQFWDWLRPGLGLHLASLDMTDDSFELGVGGHVGLWDGLLLLGGGWNLMASDDTTYWLIGGDLFAMVERVRNQGRAE